MITARQLFDASTVTPADFGADVVSPDGSEADQLAAALAHIEAKILPGARAEVSIPFRSAIGDYSTSLDALLNSFGAVKSEVVSLWDLAEISFGRSEINKQVDTNSAEYDKDSDQDRIQGNQRLKSLLGFVEAFRESQNVGQPSSGGRYGTSVSTAPRYSSNNALSCCQVANADCGVVI